MGVVLCLFINIMLWLCLVLFFQIITNIKAIPILEDELLLNRNSTINSINCGDSKFIESWIVEIHVEHTGVEVFCYGALISHLHVVTANDCKWTIKKVLGDTPIIKFPHIEDQEDIK